ncbi:hypothetical protein HDU91_003347, partial [Kappamyces sp. JEL0680]
IYPMYAVVALVLKFGPAALGDAYYISSQSQVSLPGLLLFYDSNYHVLWTISIELTYYLIIPCFVALIFSLKSYGWIANLLVFLATIPPTFMVARAAHTPIQTHLPVFLAGSCIGVMRNYIADRKAVHLLRYWRFGLDTVTYCTTLFVLSEASGMLLYSWGLPVFLPKLGYPPTVQLVGLITLKELSYPSAITGFFEWVVFQHAGMIGFSVYLVHPFFVSNPDVLKLLTDPYNSAAFVVATTFLTATVTYYLVEKPGMK